MSLNEGKECKGFVVQHFFNGLFQMHFLSFISSLSSWHNDLFDMLYYFWNADFLSKSFESF